MIGRVSFAVLLVTFVGPILVRPGPQDPAPFSKAASVRGVVVDEEGTPLKGVRCWASGYEQRVDGAWRLVMLTGDTRIHTTGVDGDFEIPSRTDVRFDVTFDADQFAPTERWGVEPGSEMRVVLRKGRSVTGTVVQVFDHDVRPITNAPVILRKPNPRGVWFESERRTGRDGRFRFAEFLPTSDGDVGWEIVYGGAVLPLTVRPGERTRDVQIEVRIAR